MTDKQKQEYYDIAIEVLKAVLKPGYLYGKGKDGNIYCVEAELPEPGQVLRMPPARMPLKGE